jgi:putative adenylate-forming enzyme
MDLPTLFGTLRRIRRLRQHERWTRPQLEVFQAGALRELRDYAYAHSPFYREFHRGLADRPLQELPVLTKSLMVEHFDDLVTDRGIHLEDVRKHVARSACDGDGRDLFLGRYRVTATSGGSGHPGFFLFDTPEWRTVMASFARGQAWAGAPVSLLRRRRMATVASVSPWHTSSQVSATARSWWTPSLRLPASDPLEDVVRRLNAWQPHQLIAYASMAGILAEEQRAGRLHISPEQVFVSSEVLTDETRRRVKEVWGDEPYNQHGATETADIAAEHHGCRHMHLFEDLLIAEVVDERYRPVPPGEYGAKLLITSLFSHTQPLIRCELGDRVRLELDACPCGLPFAVVEGVQGRVEDALFLPAASGGRVTVQPVVFNTIMDVLPVSGWQVVHEADDSLTVLVSGGRDDLADGALRGRLGQALARHGADGTRITVRQVPFIPKTRSGKAPLVVSHWPPGA